MAVALDSPFYHLDREWSWRRKEEDRRARYRGFRDATHFLDLAEKRTSEGSETGSQSVAEAVRREYRIIFMGESLDTLPFPVVASDDSVAARTG